MANMDMVEFPGRTYRYLQVLLHAVTCGLSAMHLLHCPTALSPMQLVHPVKQGCCCSVAV